MLAAHMDEIGFMVSRITPEGFIKFESLGRWWDQMLLSQQVIVRSRKGDVFGIIGSKPPHILSEHEHKIPVDKADMFIDVGASSAGQLRSEFGIREGDPIAPWAPSRVMTDPHLIAGKSWDDRAGCGLLIEALKGIGDEHPNTVVAVGTAQEEVGRRGAETSVEAVSPDVALVFEGILCGDYPGADRTKAPASLGKGPTIIMFDDSMVPNRRLLDLVIEVAEKGNIPHQIVPARGGSDGGTIQLYRTGVPTILLGIPARYIHAHLGILDVRDFVEAGRLVTAVIKRLDVPTVSWIRDWASSDWMP
jgi:endoglucanase